MNSVLRKALASVLVFALVTTLFMGVDVSKTVKASEDENVTQQEEIQDDTNQSTDAKEGAENEAADEENSNTEIEGTKVDIKTPWTFFMSGTSTRRWNGYEYCAYGSVTFGDSGVPALTEEDFPCDPNGFSDEITVSSKGFSDNFTADILSNGWSANWTEDGVLIGNNPYTLRASLFNVQLEEGHNYSVVFDAYIDSGATENRPPLRGTYRAHDKYAMLSGQDGNTNWFSTLKMKITEEPKHFTFDIETISTDTASFIMQFGAFIDPNDEYFQPCEANWTGVVHIENFAILDLGLIDGYVEKPAVWLHKKAPTGGVVSYGHVSNGTNIAAKATWDSFSVCDGRHGGKTSEWEQKLMDLPQTYLIDYGTEGWFAEEPTADGFKYFALNTGWDGEYYGDTLVADNPWGMTVQTTTMKVEPGRTYQVSFKVKSNMRGNKIVVDEDGNEKKITCGNYIKHIGFKAYDPDSPGEPAVGFDDIKEVTDSGEVNDLSEAVIELNAAEDWKTVTAEFTIPEDYESKSLAVMFNMGARMVTCPDEVAMRGYIDVSDFKVIAGGQCKVTFTGNGQNTFVYVNTDSTVSSSASIIKKLGKKGHDIDYFTLNGKKYDFDSDVTKDITLVAHYVKTALPKAIKVRKTNCNTRKKLKVIYDEVDNAVGYEIKYATKKNMKGAKIVSTKKTTYTLKQLKSWSLIWIQVRAYNLDSTGNKVYGKWGAKRIAAVR